MILKKKKRRRKEKEKGSLTPDDAGNETKSVGAGPNVGCRIFTSSVIAQHDLRA